MRWSRWYWLVVLLIVSSCASMQSRDSAKDSLRSERLERMKAERDHWDKKAMTADLFNAAMAIYMFRLVEKLPIGADLTEIERQVSEENEWCRDKLLGAVNDTATVDPGILCEGRYGCSVLMLGFYDWGLYLDYQSESQFGKRETWELACKLSDRRYLEATLADTEALLRYDDWVLRYPESNEHFWQSLGKYKAIATLTFEDNKLVSKIVHKSSWTR